MSNISFEQSDLDGINRISEKVSIGSRNRTKIAVCICGQLSRMQIHHIEPLISANNDVHFSFVIVLQLSTDNSIVYNSGKKHIGENFRPIPEASWNKSKITSHLRTILSSDNSRVESVQYVEPLNRSEWEHYMGNSTHSRLYTLDRIFHLPEIQPSILNMYRNQELCAAHFQLVYEKSDTTFQYLISTREDAYFFKAPNISNIIQYGLNNAKGCDLITKDCLGWGGISMRFQFWKFAVGLQVLSTRLAFYQSLYTMKLNVSNLAGLHCYHLPAKTKNKLRIAWNDESSYITNPECFEETQVKYLRHSICKVSMDELKVSASRHTANYSFCFIDEEVQDFHGKPCYPKSSEIFVKSYMCRYFNFTAM